MNGGASAHHSALAGQVALVTGGGRGIGRAIAQGVAAAGARVAVLARSAAQVAETVALIEGAQGHAGHAVGFAADVTDLAAMEAVVEEIERTVGAVDLLVNNAAVAGEAGPSWEIDPDAWWRCQEVNLRGPFLCTRIVLPSMVARGQGRIVNVASSAGIYPLTYASGYAVSKAALIRWSEILAIETAPHGIMVFAIHPGDVLTAMTQKVIEDEGARWLPWARDLYTIHGVPAERAAGLVRWLAAGHGDALSGSFLSIHDDVEQMAAEAEKIRKEELYRLRLRR